MKSFLTLLGYVWAAPITLVGLVYVLSFQIMGWYRFLGIYENALVWSTVPERSPEWILLRWSRLSGLCIGNVVILDASDMNVDNFDDHSVKIILIHELEHVRQCMTLGIFQPILYGLFSMVIYFFLKKSDYYWSNPFEVEARRAAGQIIDHEGAAERIQLLKKGLERNKK